MKSSGLIGNVVYWVSGEWRSLGTWPVVNYYDV